MTHIGMDSAKANFDHRRSRKRKNCLRYEVHALSNVLGMQLTTLVREIRYIWQKKIFYILIMTVSFLGLPFYPLTNMSLHHL